MADNKLLALGDLSAEDVVQILERSGELKAMHRAGQAYTPMLGTTIAYGFSDVDVATRVPCLSAIGQLGGGAVSFDAEGDTTVVSMMLNKMSEAVVLGGLKHEALHHLAKSLSVPVVSAGSDRIDPILFLADAQTYQESRNGVLRGKVVAWLGNATPRCHAYIQGAVRCGFQLRLMENVPTPPDTAILSPAQPVISMMSSLEEAIEDSDLIAFDELADGQIEALRQGSEKGGFVLPDSRTAAGDSEHYPQWGASLENRLHIWKAVIEWCLSL